MDLLGTDETLADIHALYRCHDRLLAHKEALFDRLVGRWRDLFNASFEVLLYDLTSTYFEANPPFPDDDKRRRYDRFGHDGLRGTGFREFSTVDDIFGFDLFSSIFDELGFGFGPGRRSRRRGYDVQHDLVVGFREACFGAVKDIEVVRREPCETCNGSGAKPGTSPRRCDVCGGYGKVQSGGGFFSIVQSCPKCRGQGTVLDSPCRKCSGTGRAPQRKSIEVRVPAGIEDGVRLRVPGQGELGGDGRARGDLYCFVRVEPHPLFERHGSDLVCRIPITYSQAALGTDLDVPTIDGDRATLHVPAGTRSGEVLTLPGMGAHRLNGRGRGDQHCIVNIEVPRKLSAKQEELLRQLAELEDRHVTPERKSFLDKLKDFFTEE